MNIIMNHLYEWEEKWIMEHPDFYRDSFHQVVVCMNIFKRYMRKHSERQLKKFNEEK